MKYWRAQLSLVSPSENEVKLLCWRTQQFSQDPCEYPDSSRRTLANLEKMKKNQTLRISLESGRKRKSQDLPGHKKNPRIALDMLPFGMTVVEEG
jgi:hypothetical protein